VDERSEWQAATGASYLLAQFSRDLAVEAPPSRNIDEIQTGD
jgi:hypothetical protein